MSFNVNKRSDGTRYDYTNLGSGFASCEYIIYLKHACGSVGDEVSFKMGGGRHSSGSRPRCYIISFDTDDGSMRLRAEDDHPNGYSTLSSNSGDGYGGGIALGSNWVGYCGLKRNMNGYVLLQGWQDQGNNEGATPANNWRLIGSWNISNPLWQNPPSDHQETCRVDEVSCLEYKWNSLRDILTNDTTTPGTGGVGGGFGGGGFGGTTGSGQIPGGTIGGGSAGNVGAFDQFGNYVGPGNGSYDQYGNYVGYGSGSYGGGGSTGGGSGGIGTGIDTPGIGETEIVYERKEFLLRWNINFISGDACGVGKSPETRPLKKIYDVDGDVYVDGKHYKRCGLYVANESKTDPTKNSMFIDERIRNLTFEAKRQGSNPLSGNINVYIRDIDYNIVANLGTIDASIISNNDQTIPLAFLNNIRRFKKGDHLSFEYDGNTSDDFLRIKVSQRDKIDVNNTILFVYDGVEYIYDPFADFAATIDI